MTHKDWHDTFSADRELPLISKLQQMIDPDQPIALVGWNTYVVIKKMADALDEMEATILELKKSQAATDEMLIAMTMKAMKKDA